MHTETFGLHLLKNGYTFWGGVPCSYFKNLINWAIGNTQYITSVNEGDSVACAAGAFLGGAKPVVIMQNSGLTNALSPITSLTSVYKLPFLGFVSLRTEEPQHQLMGTITEALLDLIKTPWTYLSDNLTESLHQVNEADKIICRGDSFFFLVKKDTFDIVPSVNSTDTPCNNGHSFLKENVKNDHRPLRRDVLNALSEFKDASTIFMSTTGYTSRDLFESGDSISNFYMVGSMGCIGSCALGLSLMQPSLNIVTIDGDGSLLMRLGSLSTIGKYKPSNMFHLLLNNHSYESTGCQATTASNTDFVQVAKNCGYCRSVHVNTIDELLEIYKEWLCIHNLTFVHLPITTGVSETLSRPTISPPMLAHRFRKFINDRGSRP